MKKFLLLLILGGVHSVAFGQGYSLQMNQEKVEFGENKKMAYSTSFELPFEVIKKEWWKYIKRYALLYNKRTHYENKILAKKSQSSTDIYFYSIFSNKSDNPTLSIALDDNEVIKPNIILYNQYLKDLLLDFKIELYSSHIQSKVDKSEKTSLKVSSRIERLTQDNQKLESSKAKKNASLTAIKKRIDSNNALIEGYRIELFVYQKEIDRLKNDLGRIK